MNGDLNGDELLTKISTFARDLHRDGHTFYIKVTREDDKQVIVAHAEEGGEVHVRNRVYKEESLFVRPVDAEA